MSWINPEARNPRYEESMPLCEEIRNMRYLMVDLMFGYTETRDLASDWRVVQDTTRSDKTVQCIVADKADGGTVDLCLEGVHPHPDGVWSPHRFAIRETDEGIRFLYSWLMKRQHTKAAEHLRDRFPNLATILAEDFWQDLNQHLRS